jgi:hypothetical protein
LESIVLDTRSKHTEIWSLEIIQSRVGCVVGKPYYTHIKIPTNACRYCSSKFLHEIRISPRKVHQIFWEGIYGLKMF